MIQSPVIDGEDLLIRYERHCHAAAEAADLFARHHVRGCQCRYCETMHPTDVRGVREDMQHAGWQLRHLAACSEGAHTPDMNAELAHIKQQGREVTADTPIILADTPTLLPVASEPNGQPVGILSLLMRLDKAMGEVETLIAKVARMAEIGTDDELVGELKAMGADVSRHCVGDRELLDGLVHDLRGISYVIDIGRDVVSGAIPAGIERWGQTG